ncbi:MAG: PRC-barrel domain containing protein [Methanosarcinaceae archaeon]|nr:PRC-barrel domain containing protein [Methanosarcinaceae archaeon]
MTKYNARNLLDNMKVMSTDAKELGILDNILIDSRTGSILELKVLPNPDLDTSKYRREGDYIILPFNSVSAIKDYVIVDKDKAKTFITK